MQGILQGADKADYKRIRNELIESAHVEHVLSHIGDLIAIADRSKGKSTYVGEEHRRIDELKDLHAKIQAAIKDTMRWGYEPASDDASGRIGGADNRVLSIEGHCNFLEALYHRRAGMERRPPVAFFTTNYDTLLEDAMGLSRVVSTDGFSGGTVAFWEPGNEFERPFEASGAVQARIYKLHGSIDWLISSEDIVVRRREEAGYPDESGATLLIYPQATKYKVTQRDPFATLFAAFRSALVDPQPGLLAVCGYSFGDDHINEEIERALKQRGNHLTVLAFVYQNHERLGESDRGLPSVISKWLGHSSGSWKEQIVVAGSHGVYHGSLENKYPLTNEGPHNWWSFEGVTRFLMHGPEVQP